jgi:predicted metalloprotease
MFVALALAAVVAVTGVVGVSSSSAATRYDASVESTIADIQQYWSQTLPAVYRTDYKAIPSDRLFAYSETNPPPACGGYGRTPYQEVAGNAFYCDQGDFVAWDEQGLFARLRQQYGDFAPALVLAHEWGHAIQARVGYQTSQTVYMEQQADCFAGAWAAHVASDGRLVGSDLDSALVGLLGLRDPSGTDGAQDGAHGNGFDRVRAFQDGFEGGATVCADYQNHPPTVTESGFTSYADYATGGDMNLSELLPALTKSLQSYWPNAVSGARAMPKVTEADGTNAAAACSGNTDGGVLVDAVTYCASTDTILYDRATLQQAASSVGDFAAGVLVASEWSSAVQHELGQPIGTASARTFATCLTGAFTASLDGTSRRAGSNDIMLSPGDLDEVIAMLVQPDGTNAARGSAFSRVSAFRTGYFKGVNACSKI